MTLNSDFQYCIKKYGPPSDGEPIPPEVRDLYKEIVPQSLIDFWELYGAGLWLNGKFQICRPDRYQGLLDQILANDPDFPAKTSCIVGFSALGTLFVWNNTNYALKVDLVSKIAYTSHFDKDFPILPPDRSIGSSLSRVETNSYDLYENVETSKPLFDRALKKLGKLQLGECYGFVPAVGLGGRGVLSELKKVRALEYFSIVAQLDTIELRFNDFESKKVVVVRDLGA